MRPELKIIYENLFSNYITYPLDIFPYRLTTEQDSDIITTITNELDRIEKLHSEVEIRPDAKFFILVIYHQMIAIPLLNEGKQKINSLKEYIREDIKNLLDKAYEQKHSSDPKEISAHTILNVMDAQWNNLNLAKNEWWNS